LEKEVYLGKYLRVTEATIQGRVWEKAFFGEAIAVIPIDSTGKIYLIKERRPQENPTDSWKLVTGNIDKKLGLLENVNLELQEELGMKAGTIEPYFNLNFSGGFNHIQRYFIARDLTPSKLPNPDGDDSILEIMAFSLDEILQNTLNGNIPLSPLYELIFFRLHYDVSKGRIKLI